MTSPTDLQSLSRDYLIALVVRQQSQIAELTATVETLRGEVERLTRDGKRQAAPFSKGTRVAHPKQWRQATLIRTCSTTTTRRADSRAAHSSLRP